MSLPLNNSRFLLNIPREDQDDPMKLCTHIELAYWFYLDLVRPEDSTLPGCSMKEFMAASILTLNLHTVERERERERPNLPQFFWSILRAPENCVTNSSTVLMCPWSMSVQSLIHPSGGYTKRYNIIRITSQGPFSIFQYFTLNAYIVTSSL